MINAIFRRQIILNMGFYKSKKNKGDFLRWRLEVPGHTERPPSRWLWKNLSATSAETAKMPCRRGTREKPGLVSLEVKVKVPRAGEARAPLRTDGRQESRLREAGAKPGLHLGCGASFSARAPSADSNRYAQLSCCRA